MSELSVGSLSGLAANSYVIDVASGSRLTQPGMILQVVSTAKTDTFSATTTGSVLTEITGLNATITPSSATSKILVITDVEIMSGDQSSGSIGIYRDATQIALGDSTPNPRTSSGGGRVDASHMFHLSANFLDSPATTSAITYKVYGAQESTASSRTWYVNRSATERNRTISTITLMEVAG